MQPQLQEPHRSQAKSFNGLLRSYKNSSSKNINERNGGDAMQKTLSPNYISFQQKFQAVDNHFDNGNLKSDKQIYNDNFTLKPAIQTSSMKSSPNSKSNLQQLSGKQQFQVSTSLLDECICKNRSIQHSEQKDKPEFASYNQGETPFKIGKKYLQIQNQDSNISGQKHILMLSPQESSQNQTTGCLNCKKQYLYHKKNQSVSVSLEGKIKKKIKEKQHPRKSKYTETGFSQTNNNELYDHSVHEQIRGIILQRNYNSYQNQYPNTQPHSLKRKEHLTTQNQRCSPPPTGKQYRVNLQNQTSAATGNQETNPSHLEKDDLRHKHNLRVQGTTSSTDNNSLAQLNLNLLTPNITNLTYKQQNSAIDSETQQLQIQILQRKLQLSKKKRRNSAQNYQRQVQQQNYEKLLIKNEIKDIKMQLREKQRKVLHYEHLYQREKRERKKMERILQNMAMAQALQTSQNARSRDQRYNSAVSCSSSPSPFNITKATQNIRSEALTSMNNMQSSKSNRNIIFTRGNNNDSLSQLYGGHLEDSQNRRMILYDTSSVNNQHFYGSTIDHPNNQKLQYFIQEANCREQVSRPEVKGGAYASLGRSEAASCKGCQQTGAFDKVAGHMVRYREATENNLIIDSIHSGSIDIPVRKESGRNVAMGLDRDNPSHQDNQIQRNHLGQFMNADKNNMPCELANEDVQLLQNGKGQFQVNVQAQPIDDKEQQQQFTQRVKSVDFSIFQRQTSRACNLIDDLNGSQNQKNTFVDIQQNEMQVMHPNNLNFKTEIVGQEEVQNELVYSKDNLQQRNCQVIDYQNASINSACYKFDQTNGVNSNNYNSNVIKSRSPIIIDDKRHLRNGAQQQKTMFLQIKETNNKNLSKSNQSDMVYKAMNQTNINQSNQNYADFVAKNHGNDHQNNQNEDNQFDLQMQIRSQIKQQVMRGFESVPNTSNYDANQLRNNFFRLNVSSSEQHQYLQSDQNNFITTNKTQKKERKQKDSVSFQNFNSNQSNFQKSFQIKQMIKKICENGRNSAQSHTDYDASAANQINKSNSSQLIVVKEDEFLKVSGGQKPVSVRRNLQLPSGVDRDSKTVEVASTPNRGHAAENSINDSCKTTKKVQEQTQQNNDKLEIHAHTMHFNSRSFKNSLPNSKLHSMNVSRCPSPNISVQNNQEINWHGSILNFPADLIHGGLQPEAEAPHIGGGSDNYQQFAFDGQSGSNLKKFQDTQFNSECHKNAPSESQQAKLTMQINYLLPNSTPQTYRSSLQVHDRGPDVFSTKKSDVGADEGRCFQNDRNKVAFSQANTPQSYIGSHSKQMINLSKYEQISQKKKQRVKVVKISQKLIGCSGNNIEKVVRSKKSPKIHKQITNTEQNQLQVNDTADKIDFDDNQ